MNNKRKLNNNILHDICTRLQGRLYRVKYPNQSADFVAIVFDIEYEQYKKVVESIIEQFTEGYVNTIFTTAYMIVITNIDITKLEEPFEPPNSLRTIVYTGHDLSFDGHKITPSFGYSGDVFTHAKNALLFRLRVRAGKVILLMDGQETFVTASMKDLDQLGENLNKMNEFYSSYDVLNTVYTGSLFTTIAYKCKEFECSFKFNSKEQTFKSIIQFIYKCLSPMMELYPELEDMYICDFHVTDQTCLLITSTELSS